MAADPRLFAVADQFHRAGAFAQAQRLYRKLLEGDAHDADLWRRLGEACQALGERREAEAAYHESLRRAPHAGTFNNLGVVLLEPGRLDDAAVAFRAALRLQEDFAEARNNLGLVLAELGRLDEATDHYRQAVRLKPDYAVAHHNLGKALARQGKAPEAEEHFREAVRLQPEHAQAHFHLGKLLRATGRSDEAVEIYRAGLKAGPGDYRPHNELGVALMDCGRAAEAIECFAEAARLKSDFAPAYINLGIALIQLGRLDDARIRLEQALFLAPDFVEAHYNLGRVFAEKGMADEALDCFERAVRIKPDAPGALNNLGNAYKDRGRLDEAIACYRKALAAAPFDASVHSNLLFALQYHTRFGLDDVFREHAEFGRRHTPTPPIARAPRRASSADGRLRIGYVSADFREHVVAFFFEPILASHDRERFEIYCYSDVSRPDAATRRLQAHGDQWRSLIGLSDARAAELIRRDEVDLLIDLAGHTAGNRLRMFGLRSAPVQGTYLGYMGTTGLPAVDFRVTDGYADPPGVTEQWHTEGLIRLPESGLCYRPGPAPDAIERPPALDAGVFTFGSFNAVYKVTADVITLWARVLKAAPGSRLLLKTGVGAEVDRRFREAFAAHGVGEDRVILVGRTASRAGYLELHQGVDVCLDTFPYNGITTTCDALWMGVPVVSLAGKTSVSRQGVSLLTNVGLAELIAQTPDDYVAVAARLAADPGRLASLRSGLRDRMAASPLMDARQFTRRLEAAYVDMLSKRLW